MLQSAKPNLAPYHSHVFLGYAAIATGQEVRYCAIYCTASLSSVKSPIIDNFLASVGYFVECLLLGNPKVGCHGVTATNSM